MQLSIFEVPFSDQHSSMICHSPSKRHPHGRTGTSAGYHAHRKAGEQPCPECTSAHNVKTRKWSEENQDKRAAIREKYNEQHKNEIVAYHASRYQENKESVKARSRAWYEENKERGLETRRKYRLQNIEKARDYHRSYREAHREKFLEYQQEHKLNNPDKHRQYARDGRRRRRTRINILPSDGHTMSHIINTKGTVCYLCNTEVDVTASNGLPTSPHIDHIHPLSREGCPGDVLDNTAIVHAKCNLTKGAKLVSELTLPFPAPQDVATELPGLPAQGQ